eukprot:TRINITY_DN12995_c0_g1_i1.p1 TRINITY_DN12995_c0_g1~~TRINITY_DN12995_c0_g1_i1.p1  ORF type:complete len:513 (-),score=118.22 TRINITY_DN12995_c0_g1_i1:12-1550(-)
MLFSLKGGRCTPPFKYQHTTSFFLFIFFFTLVSTSTAQNTQQTQQQERLTKSLNFDIRNHLGTKSPYKPQQNASTYSKPPQGCDLVYSDLLVRHGARYPNGKVIKSTLNLLKTAESWPVREQFKWLLNRTLTWKEEDGNELLSLGEEEHRNLAKRMREIFRQTIPSHETPQARNFYRHTRAYSFESTNKSRTIQSAQAFGESLLEGEQFAIKKDIKQDYVLRFFDHCPLYETELEALPAKTNVDSLTKERYQLIADRLSREIFEDGSNGKLSPADAKDMWHLCVYDVVQGNYGSNADESWCHFFTPEDAEVIEFAGDLSKYYSTGHGFELSYQISCHLLAQIFDRIEEKIAGTPVEIATIRFGHAETLLPLLSYLGFGKDDFILSHDSTAEVRRERTWRTSVLSPFTGNLLFLLYRCHTQDEEPSYKVKVLVNERETILPGCNNLYCPLEKIQLLHPKAFDMKCEFQKMCNENPTEPYQETLFFVVFTAVVCLLLASFVNWYLWSKTRSPTN